MTLDKIRFSIIIPTYNRAHLIKTAIQSVIDQTYGEWELLICDDGSTDNTNERISSFEDDRIKYFRLDSNQGNAAARNLGVSHSANDWITFIDSDDKYDPEYLSEFVNEIQNNPACHFFFCGYRVVRNDQVINKLIWLPVKSTEGSFFNELKIGIGCGVVVNRQCFHDIGLFDVRLRASVDTDFLIRLQLKYSFRVVNKILISISAHDGPRVRKNPIYMMEAYKLIVEKNKSVICSDRSLLKRWYYKLMWLQFHANNIEGGNNSYNILKEAASVNGKIWLIRVIFNWLPYKLAIWIHKKMAS